MSKCLEDTYSVIQWYGNHFMTHFHKMYLIYYKGHYLTATIIASKANLLSLDTMHDYLQMK